MPILRSYAPLRGSLAGGGTRVSPHPKEEGGEVRSVTIHGFAYAALQPDPEVSGGREVRLLDSDRWIHNERPDYLTCRGELDLVKSAPRVLPTVAALPGPTGVPGSH